MDELLKALQNDEPDKVRKLAKVLFITKLGKTNKPAINYFNRYAPCRIIYHEDWELNCVGGQINYNGVEYMF